METNTASRGIWKHIVCCFILLVIFVLTVTSHIDAKGLTNQSTGVSEDEVIPLRGKISGLVVELNYKSESDEVEFSGPREIVTVEYDEFNALLTAYAEEIEFFSKAFGVKQDVILKDLQARHEANLDKEFEETNFGYLLNSKGELKTFSSVEYGIVEYFYDFVEKNPKKVSNKEEPYTGKAGYVENLIIYYTTHIYTNVKTDVALSIGAAESGYYKVKGMLKVNNVFGGMSSGKLKHYKNIEYGVLSYIRMLSKNYYGKGLDTIATIGKKYCPTFDNNGNKIASPHWIKLVNNAMKKYKKYSFDIEITDLLSK